MHLVIENINSEQKKAFLAIAKAMNLQVKVSPESQENHVLRGFRNALETLKKVEEGKAIARPIEDLLNEIPD